MNSIVFVHVSDKGTKVTAEIHSGRDAFDAAHGVRNDGQIHMGPINVEGLDDSELAIACDHPSLHEEVKRFARNHREARKERLAGNIQAARNREVCAEWVYERFIPKALRW